MTPSEIRRLRRRLKLSQAGFAALVGVASNTVARWERGELGMRPTTARLIQLLADGAIKRRRAEKRAR
jgi:DNA-binding transcriptional regulator YiaG